MEPDWAAVLDRIVKANDVRGRVPDELGPKVARALGVAAAEQLAGDRRALLSGRDMRAHSAMLQQAFNEGVLAAGVDLVDIGLVATDQLYYATGALGLGGAVFTPSHNPADYGGVKFSRPAALPVGLETGLAQMRDRALEVLTTGSASAGSADAGSAGTGSYTTVDTLAGYAAKLAELVDLSAIRRLSVVVDAGNGMAGLTAPAVFAGTPVDVIPLYFELDGTFPNHEANPLVPANLVDLQAEVRRTGADVGLAFDGDADRCFLVDETGAVVPPAAVTALITRSELAAHPGASVIHNAITSTVVPEVIREAGGRPIRTRVGHAFIKAEMARTGAVFGAEHSAHYYFHGFWGADSGMLAALHVLRQLGSGSLPLSALVASFDRYVASGELNTTVHDVPAMLDLIKGLGPELGALTHAASTVRVDELDGVTLAPIVPDGASPPWWVNVRPSNTEPLLRLNVEAADAVTMQSLRDRVLQTIRGR
jgi:phosphomannomutase